MSTQNSVLKAVVAGASLALGACAESPSAPSEHAAEPVRNIEFALEGPPLVSCQTDDETGTHLRKKTVCKSDEEDRDNRSQVARSQSQLRSLGSPPTENGTQQFLYRANSGK